VLAAPLPPLVPRRAAHVAGTLAGLAARVPVERATLGGVPADRIRARNPVPGRTVLYLHGGGYSVGSPAPYRPMLHVLADAVRADVLSLDYRQAPEHRERCSEIVVAGDSAGGGLALALAQQLRDESEGPPAALALLCPWLDLTPAGAARREDPTRDALLRPAMLQRWADAYAPEDPAAASPLLGRLDGLPPIVLQSATDDLISVDAERLEVLVRRAEGAIVHHRLPGAWHGIHLLAGVVREANAALAALARHLRGVLGDEPRDPTVAIVGAGISGLAMGAALQDAGLAGVTLFEKAEEVGGTWRENRYPGLTCDVPANLYSFSWAPNPGWTSSFAPGPEIQRYVIGVAERRGLRPHVRFGAEVTDAAWEDGRWRLRTAAGEQHEADVLVTAAGVLHHPRVPDLPGLEDFAGRAFHSARWPGDLDLQGARIAVVGTGSTGVQIVTALASQTRSLLVFQRTPQWIVPVANLRYPAPVRLALARVPGLNRAAYETYRRALEGILAPAVAHDGWQRRVLTRACELNLRLGVRDPELRERLRPPDQPLCKRLVMSAGYYPALQRPGVGVVDDAIDHVRPEGIVTADGTLHELDVIVFATGFDAHAYMRPMRITGRDGLTLKDAWAGGPRGYRTVALPGFPNLFTLMGPHSPVGNHSIISVAETQARYVVRCLEEMRAHRVAALEPTAAATDAFNAELRADLPHTIWASGCRSWYLGEDGMPEVWPWSPARHRGMLAEPDLDEFVIE
jgi:cation diffusion facilitator CzcD-associated flavoprotein CzcO